jgi:hypothetical protein
MVAQRADAAIARERERRAASAISSPMETKRASL